MQVEIEKLSHVTRQGSNDEIGMMRCRICELSYQPLVRICDCVGTSSLMHAECAANLIGRRIELDQSLLIPFCELCLTPYSAKLVRGDTKIFFSLLFKNLRRIQIKIILMCIFYFVGGILAAWVFLLVIGDLFSKYFGENQGFDKVLFLDIFINFVFPMFFLYQCFVYFKGMVYILQASKVQFYQLIIDPKSNYD